MRITKVIIEKALQKKNEGMPYDEWSQGKKNNFEFCPDGKLMITKIFGRYRDYCIRHAVNDWDTKSLSVLNAEVTEILRRMQQQGGEGGDCGKVYTLRD